MKGGSGKVDIAMAHNNGRILVVLACVAFRRRHLEFLLPIIGFIRGIPGFRAALDNPWGNFPDTHPNFGGNTDQSSEDIEFVTPKFDRPLDLRYCRTLL